MPARQRTPTAAPHPWSRGGGAVPPSRSCGAPASGPSARQVRHWPGRATHAHGEVPLQPPKKATASGAGQPPTRFRGSCRKSTSSNLNMQSSQRCVSVQGKAQICEEQACLGPASPEFEPCVAYTALSRSPGHAAPHAPSRVPEEVGCPSSIAWRGCASQASCLRRRSSPSPVLDTSSTLWPSRPRNGTPPLSCGLPRLAPVLIMVAPRPQQ